MADQDWKPRMVAALGSAIFFVLAPGTVAGLMPWWIGHWQFHAQFFGFTLLRAAGFILLLAGLAVVVECLARFALTGLGTPAPVFPTRRLVVSGLYRYVRNPMYVGVLSIALGQAAIFGDARILAWGLFFWLATHVFVVAYEEPTLRRSFGDEYLSFTQNVPRWLPRLTAWKTKSSEIRPLDAQQ
jgi:protein-S-isoprenylcysteine O-methyltransferase Ste14